MQISVGKSAKNVMEYVSFIIGILGWAIKVECQRQGVAVSCDQ